MMRKWSVIAGLAGLSALLPSLAAAQVGWTFRCIDPENTSPYSDDYGIGRLENQLVGVTLGVSGTVTHGGESGPCFAPSRSLEASGRFAFFSGPTGSVQTTFDDYLAWTYGAPIDAAGDYCFARITKDTNATGTSALFGEGGINTFFRGASNRYIVSIWSDADVEANLQARVIGDAVRLRWRLRNLGTEDRPFGLLFGAYTGLHASGGQTDSQTGANLALSSRPGIGSNPKFTADGYQGIVNLPTTRPIRTERNYAASNPKFPATMEFAFGQTEFYGLKVENIPSANFQDASSVDRIFIGDWFFNLQGNTMRQSVFGDATGEKEEEDFRVDEYAFIQRFPVSTIQAGGTTDIVHYVRSTWSTGIYRDPYTSVIDAPRTIGTEAGGLNGLTPNPAQVRVYIDNQFAEIDKEVSMRNTRVRIILPPGLRLPTGQSDLRIINEILPNQISAADFQVEATGEVFGDLPVRVVVTPTPGPERNLDFNIQVAATPRLTKPSGPNLVGLPFTFTDQSLNSILGLQSGVDYQAYRWDAVNQGYSPVSSPARGQGYWLVLRSAFAGALNGAATAEDAGRGGLLTTLKRGWNLISNPYNYPVKLGDLNFVVAGTGGGGVVAYPEAVANGVINGGLAYYRVDDAGVGFYDFLNDPAASMAPLAGYWIFSNAFDDIQISWPPVFTPGLPNSGRSTSGQTEFEQSDRQWRLQLSARGKDSVDSRNFVGVASDSRTADKLDFLKPPAAPESAFDLSIVDTYRGEQTRMAQAISARTGRLSWKVQVDVKKAGDITLTWPNLESVPKNVRFRLTDEANGLVRDLRTVSGYTFSAAETGTREFTLTAEVGGSTRALIGSVVVGSAGRDANGAVNINYALTGDATVTVRILSGTGREVYTVTRGRSDSAGENSVTWTLRDNANRAVAPGVYRAEIVAESSTGERVRKIVPINVVR